jgi:hypothetical protein
MPDPLQDLTAAGVSIWLDDLSRQLLTTGALHRLVDDPGIPLPNLLQRPGQCCSVRDAAIQRTGAGFRSRFRSRGVDLLYWCRPDMEGRIPGMEALVTPHHVVDLAQLLGAT